ncbi:hypothetical protein BTR23_12980 [Alkalihalophilus pseudofirmus]|nr:hypothetical protein BTR23_12980 [Alkalihalophilus pseudofirmus]
MFQSKGREGNNRKILINEKWEQQKKLIQQLLSEEKTGEIYGRRKVDVEPVFGYLKANLRFTRMSVSGDENVINELGFAFMAVNLRKVHHERKSSIDHQNESTEKGFRSL